MNDERAITWTVSLYPRHRDIINKFTERSGRTWSNAVQRIVDQWAEEHRDQWDGQPTPEPQEREEMPA